MKKSLKGIFFFNFAYYTDSDANLLQIYKSTVENITNTTDYTELLSSVFCYHTDCT
jgi:hypothetical protein